MVGLVSDVIASPPNNLLVFVDHEYKTIVSPECASYITEESEIHKIVTLEEARNLSYEYESTCTYSSLHPERNMLWDFIGTKTGILKELSWKWDENGHWQPEVFK